MPNPSILERESLPDQLPAGVYFDEVTVANCQDWEKIAMNLEDKVHHGIWLVMPPPAEFYCD